MGFKIGQKVVCIAINNIDISTGKATQEHPKLHETVTIRYIQSDGWLMFEEYSLMWVYEPWNFRPLDYDFVEEVLEKIKTKELQET